MVIKRSEHEEMKTAELVLDPDEAKKLEGDIKAYIGTAFRVVEDKDLKIPICEKRSATGSATVKR